MEQQILQNRKQFRRDYNIKNILNKYPNYIHELIDRNVKRWRDHPEVYRTKDNNFVLVISTYCKEKRKEIENYGWTEIPSMYNHPDSISFVKCVPSKIQRLATERKVYFATENKKFKVAFHDTDFISVKDERELIDLLKSKFVSKHDTMITMSSVDFPEDNDGNEIESREFDPHVILKIALKKMGIKLFGNVNNMVQTQRIL